MNKAILIGNLTRDPEMRTTSSGISVCSFTLAINRRMKNAQGVQEADFISVVCWRQLADLCARYLTKGRKCAVVGTIQTRTYDAKDGTKRYVTEVVADEVEFLGQAGAPASGGEMSFSPQEPSGYSSGGQDQMFTPVEDDDLPF